MEVFRDLFSHDQESIENTRLRVQSIADEVDEFTEYGPGANDDKVALVGHSMFFKLMTTKKEFWSDVYDVTDQKMPCEKYSSVMKNCEF